MISLCGQSSRIEKKNKKKKERKTNGLQFWKYHAIEYYVKLFEHYIMEKIEKKGFNREVTIM